MTSATCEATRANTLSAETVTSLARSFGPVSRVPWTDAGVLLRDDAPLRAAERALDGHLEDRIRHVGKGGLTGGEHDVWLARRLVSQVAASGFSVWAYSGFSDNVWETCEALRSLHAEKAARIARRAVRLADRVEALEARYEERLDSPKRSRRDLAKRKLDALTAWEDDQFAKLDAAFFAEWHYLTVRVRIIRHARRAISEGAV
jgi:hypothetical protein